jgi:hypothetical protein
MRWLVVVASLAFGALGCNHGARAYDLDGGDLVVVGAAFVEQRGCATCHQPSDGSGTLAGDRAPLTGTLAFPANLTPDRQTGIGGWADVQIVRAVRYGVDNQGAELCPTMPRFSAMGTLEADAIVAYLRSLPSVAHMIPDSNCPPVKPLPMPDMALPPTDL